MSVDVASAADRAGRARGVTDQPDALRQAQPGGERPGAMKGRVPGVRYPLLDLLRVVAMLDILSVHLTGVYLIGGAGLPVFIITAVALAVRRPTPPPVTEVARKRAGRVLLPWLFWSGFFGLGLCYAAWVDPRLTLGEAFEPWMWVAGTKIHLWFLPFIFVAELAAVGLTRRLERVRPGPIIVAMFMLAAAATVTAGAAYDHWHGTGDLAERHVAKSWLFGLVSIPLGVAVGRSLADCSTPEGDASRSRRTRRLLLLVGGVAWLGLTVWRWSAASSHHVVWLGGRQALALLLVAAAVQWQGSTPTRLTRVASLTMGIYLLHGSIHALIYDRLLAHLWDRVPYLYATMTSPGCRIAVTWLCTAWIVAMLRRSQVCRRVL